jgi:PIN domain nuclease of toxin-antitoxin system
MGGLGIAEVILLDTHVLVWMLSDSGRLSKVAARELRKAEQNGELAIASITLWELALLYHSGRLRTSGTVESAIRTIVEKSGVQVIEVTPEIAALSTSFPETYPRDPGDRLIGATARAYGLTVVTQDERMLSSPLLRALW